MRRWAIIVLVFVVAGAVLVESWHAAANAAATGGRPWPWLWPVTLEAFIAVLVLVYWDARSDGSKAWTARVFLVLTTGVASAVQILDAPATWLGWVTAGWTPVALLLSVEFAVGRLYRIRENGETWTSTSASTATPTTTATREPATRTATATTTPTPGMDSTTASTVTSRGNGTPTPRATTMPSSNGSRLTREQENQIISWVLEGRRNKAQMARDLDLNNRGRLAVGRLVDDLVQSNGHGGGS